MRQFGLLTNIFAILYYNQQGGIQMKKLLVSLLTLGLMMVPTVGSIEISGDIL